ncbi:TPA: SMI1/KNR4 family protein [Stenotrophomonas maltophilia]|nr:SMI1/KNR4 family protein [Stenotrophomonas maltophilia]HDS1154642.1 SMI1/KNR4 family protein [Stenotrophomonas maltophilia]HDS1167499.1 SMI1/KNR4 family protein [Stenotrophomonas maltophilia]HDS1170645.1 SMI1/KNR4 family protein [Stenotrophomonas maltophilia]HDS1177309.1 SMI1/KNR4 family protein [Stenotrophomonas maltophilia]
MSYIDILESEINASGEDPAYAGEATDADIEDFEKALGVKFPASYKAFLKKYGALSFGGDTYYGITKGGVEATSVPNVAFATRSARVDGDADDSMIVVKSSGYGPIYSIDTSIIGESGEPVIVETELSFKRTKEKNVIYQSFGDFITDMVKQAIQEL